MTQPSPLYRLIEAKLDEPLADFVARRRAPVPRLVPDKSWREIVDEILDLTGERVGEEAIRKWFVDASAAPTRTGRAA